MEAPPPVSAGLPLSSWDSGTRAQRRDSVSSKQRKHNHKQSCAPWLGIVFCFLFKAVADGL